MFTTAGCSIDIKHDVRTQEFVPCVLSAERTNKVSSCGISGRPDVSHILHHLRREPQSTLGIYAIGEVGFDLCFFMGLDRDSE